MNTTAITNSAAASAEIRHLHERGLARPALPRP